MRGVNESYLLGTGSSGKKVLRREIHSNWGEDDMPGRDRIGKRKVWLKDFLLFLCNDVFITLGHAECVYSDWILRHHNRRKRVSEEGEVMSCIPLSFACTSGIRLPMSVRCAVLIEFLIVIKYECHVFGLAKFPQH